MPDKITISGPDAQAFAKAFSLMGEAVRRGLVDKQFGTLPTQGRLLAQDIQRNTPPKSVSVGNKAVERSLKGLTRPLTEEQFTSAKLRKVIKEGDVDAWNVISTRFKQTNRLYNSYATGFEPAHYQRRRAFKPPRRLVLLQPEVKQFKKFVKTRQMHVGRGKAAWNKAIIALGGKHPAKWISRHGTRDGIYIDGMTGANPRITIGNASSWAKNSRNPEDIIKRAIQRRAAAMQKYVYKQMELAGRQGERLAGQALRFAKILT